MTLLVLGPPIISLEIKETEDKGGPFHVILRGDAYMPDGVEGFEKILTRCQSKKAASDAVDWFEEEDRALRLEVPEGYPRPGKKRG